MLWLLNGHKQLLKQAGFIGAQRAFEHQPVRCMITAKDGALQLQCANELLHFAKQFSLFQRAR